MMIGITDGYYNQSFMCTSCRDRRLPGDQLSHAIQRQREQLSDNRMWTILCGPATWDSGHPTGEVHTNACFV